MIHDLFLYILSLFKGPTLESVLPTPVVIILVIILDPLVEYINKKHVIALLVCVSSESSSNVNQLLLSYVFAT